MTASKTFFLCFLIALISQSTLSAQATQYMGTDSTFHFWGDLEMNDLTAEPHPWLAPDTYQPDATPAAWASQLQDARVQIFLGTWCGDSEEWVPAFVEHWIALGLSPDQLEFIALHNVGDDYKQGPDGETLGLNIHRVPTFIVSKENKEIGRIVERPLNDLATDLRQIAEGVPSQPRYRAVERLHQLMEEQPIDSIYANSGKYLRELNREVSKFGELNTYARVLKVQGRDEAVLLTLLINKALFRYTPNCHDSLGEIYVEREDWDKAKQCFEEVIRLKGEDKYSTEMLEMIAEKMEEGR